MTAEEHKLMVTLLALQIASVKSLATALKSRGVLDSDDLPAYAALIASEEKVEPDVSRAAMQVYLGVAKECGIDVRLPAS